jgi:hypothetical protein
VIVNKDDDEPVEPRDGIFELIRWQREDRARTRIESGDLWIDPRRDLPVAGAGEYSDRLAAMVGDSPEMHLVHMRHAVRQAVEDNPQIYVIKRGARYKGNFATQLDRSPVATNISVEQFVNLYSAVAFANGNGVLLDVHVIIHWSRLGYRSHEEAAEALQERFIKHLDSWYYYQQEKNVSRTMQPLAWIYTHECSAKGEFHTHFLTHVPVRLRDEFRAWMRKRAGKLEVRGGSTKGAVRVVGPPSDPIGRQWRFFQYLCKGLDPDAVVPLYQSGAPCRLLNFIQFQYINPGHIECKQRFGMSRNINAASRNKVRFRSAAELGKFDVRELYNSAAYDEWYRYSGEGLAGLVI